MAAKKDLIKESQWRKKLELSPSEKMYRVEQILFHENGNADVYYKAEKEGFKYRIRHFDKDMNQVQRDTFVRNAPRNTEPEESTKNRTGVI